MRHLPLVLLLSLLWAGPATSAPEVRTLSMRTQAEALMQRGQVYKQKGDLEAAIATYTEALILYPDYIAAYVARGGALGTLQDYDGAIADFDVALTLDPTLAGAYGARGLARFRSGDNIGGMDDLWQAAQLYRQQDEMGRYHHTLGIIRTLAP